MSCSKIRQLIAILILASVTCSRFALAQEDESFNADSDLEQIEAEIQTARPLVGDQTSGIENEKVEDLSGLSRLAPFSEVSVIQKRYQPKTGRFQMFAGLSNIVNDPWYLGLGADLRAAYHFSEAWGVELQGLFLGVSERQAIKDLDSENNVKTSSVISFKGYTGAAIMWSPIYGKMGYLNRKIVPFDMYFSLGVGNTSISNGSGGSTIHFGSGQTYAISKGTAFRWDFSWNAVRAKPTGASEQNFNNLLVSLGVSFFFPEAGYR